MKSKPVLAIAVAVLATALFFLLKGDGKPAPREDTAESIAQRIEAARQNIAKLRRVSATLQSKDATIKQKNTARKEFALAFDKIVKCGAAALPELQKEFATERESFLRLQLFKAIANIEDKKTVALVEKGLADRDSRVRLEALKAVRRFARGKPPLIEKKRAVGLLIDTTKDKNTEVAKAAVWCLLPFAADSRVAKRLDELAKSSNAELKKAAVGVRGKIGGAGR